MPESPVFGRLRLALGIQGQPGLQSKTLQLPQPSTHGKSEPRARDVDDRSLQIQGCGHRHSNPTRVSKVYGNFVFPQKKAK